MESLEGGSLCWTEEGPHTCTMAVQSAHVNRAHPVHLRSENIKAPFDSLCVWCLIQDRSAARTWKAAGQLELLWGAHTCTCTLGNFTNWFPVWQPATWWALPDFCGVVVIFSWFVIGLTALLSSLLQLKTTPGIIQGFYVTQMTLFLSRTHAVHFKGRKNGSLAETNFLPRTGNYLQLPFFSLLSLMTL